MKKRLISLSVLLVVLAVMFAGCGAPANSVTGMWYDEAGMAGTIDFKADGNCKLSAMGIDIDATYKFDAAAGKGTMTLMGQDAEFTVSDGKLKVSDGTTYTRTKVEQQSLEDMMEGLGEALEGLGDQ